jgi:hypothetical protein
MTRDELLKIREDLTTKARNLMKKKNADFTQVTTGWNRLQISLELKG